MRVTFVMYGESTQEVRRQLFGSQEAGMSATEKNGAGTSVPLTQAEAAALKSVGSSHTDISRPAQIVDSSRELETISIQEAVKRLGVTQEYLHQRIAEKTLIAVQSPGGAIRLASFQFTNREELPSLCQILLTIRGDLSAVQVAAFFMTPQTDLEDEAGAPMTPISWLISGNDVDTLKHLANHL